MESPEPEIIPVSIGTSYPVNFLYFAKGGFWSVTRYALLKCSAQSRIDIFKLVKKSF